MKKGHLHSYLCCHHIAEKLLQHFTCGLVFQHFPHYLLRWLHATGSSHGKPVQNFATPSGATKKKILRRLSLATFAPLQNWALLIGFLDFVLKYHWLQSVGLRQCQSHNPRDEPAAFLQFILRPVYTLRFVGPICRPDSVGAQIVRVFWHPIYGRFVKTKIGPIQKICCSATDFCVVGPTLSKKPTCRSKFWAESMRINQKQSKWRTRRLRRGQSRAVSKRKKSPFW